MAVNTTIGASIKNQIMVQLANLQTLNMIKTIYEIDLNSNPLLMTPANGYPFAVVSMPRVTADFEDQANDMQTYRFDVLVVINPEELADSTTGVESIIDAVLSQFNQISALTLNNTAVAAVLPVEIESLPVSTGDKTYLCFVATIRARALYQTT